jgi:hypothetical protein
MDHKLKCRVTLWHLQTDIIPEFILFLETTEEEMEKRILGRNQVLTATGPGTLIKKFFAL